MGSFEFDTLKEKRKKQRKEQLMRKMRKTSDKRDQIKREC